MLVLVAYNIHEFIVLFMILAYLSKYHKNYIEAVFLSAALWLALLWRKPYIIWQDTWETQNS